jgi:hypothetical protein
METLVETRPADAGLHSEGRIGTITYRSRANGLPSWQELDALTRSAQRRNRAAGLTGTLLYEDGRFFQCIEGPPETLEPVWDSIRKDRRHRDIQVLSMQIGPARLFTGWDMRWLRRGQRPGPEGTITPGLQFLDPIAPSDRLARALLADDAFDLAIELDRTHPRTPLAVLLDDVMEPVARALGDAWMRDDIDEVALTLTLERLHRVVHERARQAEVAPGPGRRLLAVTFPGEVHLLGAIAAAELHVNAGWLVDLEFPRSTDALLRLVSRVPYDRVDIASSDAIERDGVRAGAEGLARRIAAASPNPDIEVSFGGRAFWADDSHAVSASCRVRSSAADHRV